MRNREWCGMDFGYSNINVYFYVFFRCVFSIVFDGDCEMKAYIEIDFYMKMINSIYKIYSKSKR